MAVAGKRSVVGWIGRKVRRQFRHGSLRAWVQHALDANTGKRYKLDFYGDGVGVRDKNLAALKEPRFVEAYQEARRLDADGWGGETFDILWRAHIACWAAKHALTIEGDFVECGVNTGLLSRTICGYLDFGKLDRRFWLFDTWAGIPDAGETPDEVATVRDLNARLYKNDVYPIAQRNFAPFPNVRLVRGVLPGTLAEADLGRIAYLSIDLNTSRPERAVIEALWDRLSRGAVVLLDDYAFRGHPDQHDMWDAFAARVGTMVATLPTGQGLMIR